MSRTYKHIHKGKLNRLRIQDSMIWETEHKSCSRIHWRLFGNPQYNCSYCGLLSLYHLYYDKMPHVYKWDYGHNPMWWNHLYSIKPARVRNKRLMHTIKKDVSIYDKTIFWDYKKPVEYYW